MSPVSVFFSSLAPIARQAMSDIFFISDILFLEFSQSMISLIGTDLHRQHAAAEALALAQNAKHKTVSFKKGDHLESSHEASIFGLDSAIYGLLNILYHAPETRFRRQGISFPCSDIR